MVAGSSRSAQAKHCVLFFPLENQAMAMALNHCHPSILPAAKASLALGEAQRSECLEQSGPEVMQHSFQRNSCW